jgi:hypothetical protein
MKAMPGCSHAATLQSQAIVPQQRCLLLGDNSNIISKLSSRHGRLFTGSA